MKPFSDTGGPEQTRGANIPLHQRSDLMMRRMESGPSLTAKLLSNQAGDHENERGITDPLFQGLIDRLPKPDDLWPLEERARWLRTAASIFDLLYKPADDERSEIGIVIVKPQAHTLKEESPKAPSI
jgi:hypothetical protein